MALSKLRQIRTGGHRRRETPVQRSSRNDQTDRRIEEQDCEPIASSTDDHFLNNLMGLLDSNRNVVRLAFDRDGPLACFGDNNASLRPYIVMTGAFVSDVRNPSSA